MNKILTPFIQFAINIAKRNKFIQNIFENPFDLEKFPKDGVFVDSNGFEHQLLSGLRSKIKPGWERMLKNQSVDLSDEFIQITKTNGSINAQKLIELLNIYNKSIFNTTVLEIGCHSGAATFALAKHKTTITGSEFSGYKIESTNQTKSLTSKLIEVNNDLVTLRSKLQNKYYESEKVNFVDDDICNSKLEQNHFDIICSWDVLEHLHDPQGAFNSIFELLKEDGITIHEYNSFFSLNGGHSLCTFDFLWGHTRLSASDTKRYFDEIRPIEKEKANSFYTNGLNRMTLADLKNSLDEAGFETLAIVPFSKEQHLRMIDHDVLSQTINNYPTVTITDLCTPKVYVIARKPKKN